MLVFRATKKPPILWPEVAFIVIDMQRDFVELGGKFVPEGSYYEKSVKEIIAPIKKVLEFGLESDIPVIYIKTVYHPDYVDATRMSMPRELGAVKRGSSGAEIIDQLVLRRGRTYVVEAQRHDKFHGTNLEIVLHGLGIRTVILMGVATNVCVESTARAAKERDLFPIVLSDCTATFEEGWKEGSLNIIDRFFGSVLTSKELLDHST